MLGSYREQLPGRLDRLRGAAREPEALRRVAHELRSPSASFGLARLAEQLRTLEATRRRAVRPRRRRSTP